MNGSSYATSEALPVRTRGVDDSPYLNSDRTSPFETSRTASSEVDKYWRSPGSGHGGDIVVIHVCDENRQISKDFCCRRSILVKNMKYFEKFISENETGYDDIDISVHCDVEIFEWLMAYIHEPDRHPQLDKSIVVSILISSDFLQMESLVDVCLHTISASLGDIIRLPIDLSCISDKIINKLAVLTHPKVLAQTKDRKDKILNKLYKRRVELDFSRKSGARGGTRTIAASLTCCRHCGIVYLDSCVSLLSCSVSPATIEFRGRLARRHSAIPGWSLTSYLKSLHAGGMGWDAIYWHVWAACIVVRASDVMVSALEVDKYCLEIDGILVKDSRTNANSDSEITAIVPPKDNEQRRLKFSLSCEQERSSQTPSYKILAVPYQDDSALLLSHITPTLNPLRPPEVLSHDIYELLCSQMKYISALPHRPLIESITRTMMNAAPPVPAEDVLPGQISVDYGKILWGETDGYGGDEREDRGRSRSPGRAAAAAAIHYKDRKSSLSTKRRSSTSANLEADVETVGILVSAAINNTVAVSERRSRSVSLGNRRSGGRKVGLPTSKSSSKTAASTGENQKASSSSDGQQQGLEEEDWSPEAQLAILKSLPPEILRRCGRGAPVLKGVWMVAHPLQSQPFSLTDSLSAVSQSSLSKEKKLEWQLDLLREYDEKRMDRFEAFLVSKRIAAAEEQLRPVGKYPAAVKRFALKNSNDYYKDRARVPNKTPLSY